MNKDNLQYMTEHLRNGIDEKNTVTLSGEVECDECYIIAGHKGQLDKVKLAKRPARRRRLKVVRGRGTLANEMLLIFDVIQRSGEVVMRMLENTKRDIIKYLISKIIFMVCGFILMNKLPRRLGIPA